MGAICRTVAKALSIATVTFVILLAFFLGGTRLIGLSPYAVLSGSMEPTYQVGSIIYVSGVNPEDLKVGDPVTYKMQSGTIVTHRVENILNDGGELSFETKGDANEVSDGVISASAVIGKPRFCIPFLGYASEFVKNPLGLACIVGCCLAVLALYYVIDALFPKEKKSEQVAPQSAEEPR